MFHPRRWRATRNEARPERFQPNVFKAKFHEDESKDAVAEEIKSIVLNYLGGQDGFNLPENLQKEEEHL